MSPGFLSPTQSPAWLVLGVLVFIAPAARAQSPAYSVEIRPALNGLEIQIGHVADSTMLVVNLTNNSTTRARCKLRFDAAPQTPYRTTVHMNPGQTETSVLRAKRRWFSVTVDVACEPAPK